MQSARNDRRGRSMKSNSKKWAGLAGIACGRAGALCVCARHERRKRGGRRFLARGASRDRLGRRRPRRRQGRRHAPPAARRDAGQLEPLQPRFRHRRRQHDREPVHPRFRRRERGRQLGSRPELRHVGRAQERGPSGRRGQDQPRRRLVRWHSHRCPGLPGSVQRPERQERGVRPDVHQRLVRHRLRRGR